MVYADFESILKPVNEDVYVTQGVETGMESSSRVVQEHIPYSFAEKIVSLSWGEDAAEKFVPDLQLEAKQLFDEYIVTSEPILLTGTESRSFDSTTICHTCTKPLEDDKVRDHCHITGNYRDTAHNECNLMYWISKTGWKLPVIIHNLKGYDDHLIVKALKSEFGEVKVIPHNMEKYLSLAVGQIKFIDSFQFTPQGLDSLVKTLADDEIRYLSESYTSLFSAHSA